MDLILPNEIRPCLQMATGGRHCVFGTGPDRIDELAQAARLSSSTARNQRTTRFQLAKFRVTTFSEQFRHLREGRGVIEWLWLRLGCVWLRRVLIETIDGRAIGARDQMSIRVDRLNHSRPGTWSICGGPVMQFGLRPGMGVLVPLIAVLTACGGGSSPTPLPPSPREMSPIARTYLTQLLDIMQANSINRKTIDWPAFRQTVIGVESNAQTIQDLYPRIRAALSLLNDHHSFYVGPDSTSINSPPLAGCTELPPPAVQVPEGIGYVRVGSFTGRGSAEAAFAQAIHDIIGAQDRTNLTGWIVDVRNNGGGNMWPMVAGLGPILGDGTAGGFVDADGGITWWGYRDRASIYDGSPLVTVTSPYRLLRPDPRVAVLTNCGVASSGEAVVIGFRARRDARSFGTSTRGLSTSNEEFTLTGGGTLLLTVSTMTDRTGRPYGGAVAPDETIADPVETVRRALEWLRQ